MASKGRKWAKAHRRVSGSNPTHPEGGPADRLFEARVPLKANVLDRRNRLPRDFSAPASKGGSGTTPPVRVPRSHRGFLQAGSVLC